MSVPKPVVIKDPAYLTFLRSRPCVCSGWGDCDTSLTIGRGPCEASHLQGKSRDDLAVPMCGGHHRTNVVSWHHGQQTFMAKYGWTKEQLVAHAAQLYRGWKQEAA